MMKTNSRKLPVFIAIWAVIILAGLAILLIPSLRFNMASSVSDNNSLIVSYDLAGTLGENEDAIGEICKDAFKANDVNYIDYDIRSTSTDGEMEFKVSDKITAETLNKIGEEIVKKISENENLSTVTCNYQIAYNETYLPHSYISRAVISTVVILVVAGVYVFIRYNFSMGVATLVAGLADVLVMLALTLIFRVPVTSSLAVAAVMAALLSVVCSLVKFGGMRPLLKSEEYSELSPAEAVDKASAATKGTWIFGCVAFGFFLALGVVGFFMSGTTILLFAASGMLSVIASLYSSNFVSPAIVAAMKEKGKAMKEKRLAEKQAAKLEAERAKAEKRDRKQD